MRKTLFCPTLWESFDQDVFIDFTPVTFSEPWCILMLAESIRRFIEFRNETDLTALFGDFARIEKILSRGVGYLKHIGFFYYFGVPVGKNIGDARITRKHTPIYIIRKDDIDGIIFQNNIEHLCRNISEILYPEDLEAQDMITYCLREIVRNTFEHAHMDRCAFIAQQWTNGSVELAVLDSGRGIYDSLKERYELPDNRAALLHAIQPGVSEADLNALSGEWGNSGFGLYIAAELGRICGDFMLCSNGDILRVNKLREYYEHMYFYGTSIRLFLNTREAEYFPNIRKQIVDKGERIASERAGQVRKASVKSMH